MRLFDSETHYRDQVLEKLRGEWLRSAHFALVQLACFGIIWDLDPVPARVYARAEENKS